MFTFNPSSFYIMFGIFVLYQIFFKIDFVNEVLRAMPWYFYVATIGCFVLGLCGLGYLAVMVHGWFS